MRNPEIEIWGGRRDGERIALSVAPNGVYTEIERTVRPGARFSEAAATVVPEANHRKVQYRVIPFENPSGVRKLLAVHPDFKWPL